MACRIKLIQKYKGWKIYSGYSDYSFSAFLPETSPRTFDSPEWEEDNLDNLKDFIDCYH